VVLDDLLHVLGVLGPRVRLVRLGARVKVRVRARVRVKIRVRVRARVRGWG